MKSPQTSRLFSLCLGGERPSRSSCFPSSSKPYGSALEHGDSGGQYAERDAVQAPTGSSASHRLECRDNLP